MGVGAAGARPGPGRPIWLGMEDATPPHARIRVADLETAGGAPDDVCESAAGRRQGPDGLWRVDSERRARS